MAWACDRSPAGFVGSNPTGGTDVSLSCVVCCQVEVSATGWSLVQRNPTECGASECYCSLDNEEAVDHYGGCSTEIIIIIIIIIIVIITVQAIWPVPNSHILIFQDIPRYCRPSEVQKLTGLTQQLKFVKVRSKSDFALSRNWGTYGQLYKGV